MAEAEALHRRLLRALRRGAARSSTAPSPRRAGRGYVTTVLGRRRYLPELGARDPAVRQFAERTATNTPIQGSAADLIKLAMLAVRRRARERAGLRRDACSSRCTTSWCSRLPRPRSRPRRPPCASAMEGVWPLKVPLQVDVRAGANWAEVH